MEKPTEVGKVNANLPEIFLKNNYSTTVFLLQSNCLFVVVSPFECLRNKACLLEYIKIVLNESKKLGLDYFCNSLTTG